MTAAGGELAGLQRFAGIWNTTGALFGTDGRQTGTMSATDLYRWLPGWRTLIHEVDARMDGAALRSIEVLTWDAARGTVVSRSFDQDGGVADFACRLDRERWEIDGQGIRFRGRFDGADRLAGTWEMHQTDGWRRWIDIVLDRAV